MLNRLKIGSALMLGFAVALCAALLIAVVAWVGLRQVEAGVEELADNALPSSQAMAEVDEAETAVMRFLNALMISRTSREHRADSWKELDAALQRFAEGRKAWESRPSDPETVAVFNKMTAAADPVFREVREIMNMLRERDRLLDGGAKEDGPELQRLSGQIGARYEELERLEVPVDEALPLVRKAMLEQSERQAHRAQDAGSAATAALAVALAFGAALVVALGVVLTRSIQRSLSVLVAESGKLSAAVGKGQLAVRGDADRVHFQFRPVVEGMNATMDAFTRPLELTADYVTRISKGEIPPPISQRAEGDFARINGALNQCIETVNVLVADAGMLAKAGVEGRLSTRADASRHQGDFRRIVQGVNDTLDAVVGPLNVAATCVDRIAKGDVPEKIAGDYRGDFEVIKKNLNTCIDAVNALVADAGMLSRAAVAGALATRADASRHQGDFRKIVQGVNDTLDAVVGPLNVAAGYVERISRGEIPAPITDAYAGDFGKIKDNLNTCIGAVNRLVQDANVLVEAAVTGKLSTRADASKHQGDFRKIVDGVNRTLDAVMAPIQESAGVLERLAQRDLTARVSGSFQGDHAKIKESVNATGEALHEALAQVAQAVDQVSSAAAQIASSSQAVASGASEQASSLEETTASVDSVASMTKQSADNAQQANQLAAGARTAATEGASSMEQMQAAMGKIKASAEGTSQIIRDINDIAFQTNLLALNAAVEAARAGEAGRGFAVVAEEVRSLALRAKEAATKTEELIRQSVKEANDGEVTAKHVAGKLTEIVEGVGKVTDIVSEIAAAAKEQATGIEQVNKAIGEMDKVTQQNAASAEESSSAASELSGQAEELAAMVGAFRLSRQGGQAKVAARPAAKAAALPAPPRNGKHARADESFPMGGDDIRAEF